MRSRKLTITIESLQELAVSRGGKLLSTEYKNNKEHLLWECDKKHTWKAGTGSIKSGSWCPKCANVEKLTIEELQNIAINRGGKLLSTKYINSWQYLIWECSEGHIWEARALTIKYKNCWCPKCSGKLKLTIQDLQKIAIERGGKLLSTKYKNIHEKLIWECEKGHSWKSTAGSVKHSKSWCPKCAYIIKHNNLKLTIEELKQIALERGGKCLSDVYIGIKSPILWECANMHTWEVSAHGIKNGTWCPYCYDGSSEKLCREYFEQIFQEKFPTKRPVWLVNEKGNRLELDGFCEKLKIAFEYNGEQHYKTTKIFARQNLEEIQLHDKIKNELCVQKGIKLITISALETKSNATMKEYIGVLLTNQDILLPSNFNDISVNINKRYDNYYLEKCKQIAIEKGGKCLSSSYWGLVFKLPFWCSVCQNTWEATPSSIIHTGAWCPYCSKCKKLTIEEMQQLAIENGGKCLSKTYVNSKSKLEWQCGDCKNIWWATPNSIKIRNSWCPDCFGSEKLTIEEMRQIAIDRGGKCLSNIYINSWTKLEWQCGSCQYIWQTTPDCIKNDNTWCPKRCKY